MKDLQKSNVFGTNNNVSGLSAFLQSIKGVKQEIVELPKEKAISFFDTFNEKTKISAQETADYIDTVRVSNSTMADYLQSIGNAQPTFQGYQAYCQQAAQATQQLTLKAKAGQIVMKGLALAGNMVAGALISWGVSKVISGVVGWIDDLTHAEEKRQQVLILWLMIILLT